MGIQIRARYFIMLVPFGVLCLITTLSKLLFSTICSDGNTIQPNA